MAVLTQPRMARETTLKIVALPLAIGAKAFQGGIACFDSATNTVKQGAAGNTNLVKIGEWQDTLDNSAGAATALTLVNLDTEILVRWYDNAAGGAAITAANIFDNCYLLDDHTVTNASTGNAAAGRVWAIDAVKGVAVQGGVSAGSNLAGSGSVANLAALQAVAAAARSDGLVVLKRDDGTYWRFNAASVAVDASNSVVVAPSVGTGAWILMDDVAILTLPFTFATADATVLFTVPVGCILHPRESWWEIGASMTGGAASAIGLHASNTATTKGDILGGAGGDVAATLVAGAAPYRMVGTIGAKLATRTLDRIALIAADTIQFDAITSAFTAGSGNARVLCDIIANRGA